ncbi:universal stress protein [Halorhodospira neutriphila]|uniref:UspA domain-containing protein n=1 Tax=Halorhodospira neutriphila TaxID=168379 RepID=A0ABS1E3B0_9GAMM|nr:hypothetical protein [Halorhodospira neutriphila]
MQRILLATDLSPQADGAARRAIDLSRRLGAELRAIHVLEADLDEQTISHLFRTGAGATREETTAKLVRASEEQVAEQLARAADGAEPPSYSVASPFGRGHAEIAAEAEAWRADAVVVGARGHHALRDLFLGTTAEALTHEMDRPVLVVKAPPQGGYRRAVVPVDFSERSRQAVEHAAQLAPDAELELLHVFNTAPLEWVYRANLHESQLQGAIESGRQEGEQRLAELAEGLEKPLQRTLHCHVATGYPSRVITERARERGADLICLGTRGHSHWRGTVAGSVARRVLQQAECDVAVERGPR